MTFHSSSHISDGVATIRISGELLARSAGQLNRLINEVAEQRPTRVVFLMADLTRLSSAGLRSLVFAHQRLGRSVEIVLVGARPEVAEMIRHTGLDQSVVMQEPMG